MRRPRSTRERARLFELHGGICHLCSGKIHAGEGWDLEHVIPLGLTGEDIDDNIRPAHRKCHKAKTRDDSRSIAKAKRQEAKHNGTWSKRKSFGTRTRINDETGAQERWTGFRWKEIR